MPVQLVQDVQLDFICAQPPNDLSLRRPFKTQQQQLVEEAAHGAWHPQTEGHRNMKLFCSRGRIAPRFFRRTAFDYLLGKIQAKRLALTVAWS